MEFSILKDILKPKVLAGFIEEWKPEKTPILEYMPYKAVPALQYQIVQGSESRPMSDVVAYDTAYPRKSRPALSKISGNLPALRIMRQMNETDLNSFMQFNAMKTPDTQAVIELIFNDIIYCFKAVLGRLNWLGFQALSTGIISLTKLNNAGIITETDITFHIDNTSGASVVWNATDLDTTKPITDIEVVCALARTKGIIIKKILMSPTSFSHLRKSQESVNFCFGQSGSLVSKYPNLATINENLIADGLPPIDLIQSILQFENEDHDITNLVAWNEGSVAFLPQDQIGAILHCRTAEEEFPPKCVTQEKKDIVLISKWSENAPIREFTSGACNGFPGIKLANSIFLMNSLATSWTGE
ncbi:hypothetical protein ES705_28640 [subsurface metagenome]